uniref:Uncharacterized protein n=1 Tax=Oryza rufipogon TaxID=4529 RepID=A0A0E0NVB9_ORYRU
MGATACGGLLHAATGEVRDPAGIGQPPHGSSGGGRPRMDPAASRLPPARDPALLSSPSFPPQIRRRGGTSAPVRSEGSADPVARASRRSLPTITREGAASSADNDEEYGSDVLGQRRGGGGGGGGGGRERWQLPPILGHLGACGPPTRT